MLAEDVCHGRSTSYFPENDLHPMLDSLYLNKGQVKAAFVSFDFFHLHIKESLDSLFPKKKDNALQLVLNMIKADMDDLTTISFPKPAGLQQNNKLVLFVSKSRPYWISKVRIKKEKSKKKTCCYCTLILLLL